jgi:hypothetical protein
MPKNAKFNSTLYSRAYVYQKYVVEDMNASELGREIGCHPSAVLAAVSRFGIPTKTMSEVIQKIPHTGSSAPRPRAEFKDTLHNKSWVVEHFVIRDFLPATSPHWLGVHLIRLVRQCTKCWR